MKNNLKIKDTIPKALVILMVSCVFVATIYGYIQGTTSSRWPTANGTIVSSIVKKTVRPTQEGNKTAYSAQVVYKYPVNNRQYSCDRVSIGKSAYAEATVKKYPTGKAVTVYYNPDKPQEAVLEPGLKWGDYWRYILFDLLIALSLIVPQAIKFYETIQNNSLLKRPEVK